MVKNIKVVICVFLVVFILILGLVVAFKKEIIIMNYWLLQDELNEVASFLNDSDYYTIYAGKKHLVDEGEITTNSIITKELLELDSYKRLVMCGYDEVIKDYGAIFFVDYGIFIHKGVFYSLDDVNKDSLTLATNWEMIDDDWYYFEQR